MRQTHPITLASTVLVKMVKLHVASKVLTSLTLLWFGEWTRFSYVHSYSSFVVSIYYSSFWFHANVSVIYTKLVKVSFWGRWLSDERRPETPFISTQYLKVLHVVLGMYMDGDSVRILSPLQPVLKYPCIAEKTVTVID